MAHRYDAICELSFLKTLSPLRIPIAIETANLAVNIKFSSIQSQFQVLN
jgi:hypothetical protein